jgi:hypothetical protein
LGIIPPSEKAVVLTVNDMAGPPGMTDAFADASGRWLNGSRSKREARARERQFMACLRAILAAEDVPDLRGLQENQVRLDYSAKGAEPR